MKRITTILLEINIIANMVMMLFSCENSMDKVKMFIDNDTINGLMAYDIVIERSDSGTMVARLAAPLMISVDQGDSTLIEFPKGFNAVAFNGDTIPTMKIRGDYGINNEIDQYIIAKRNVVIENIETGETLETDNLFWDQKKKKIYTRAFVTIKGPDRIIYGDSLTADEDFSKRVIHGIRATIDIEDDNEN